MAPQDDLTAERAAQIADYANECSHRSDGYREDVEAKVLEALKQTRQEAMREGPSHLRQMAAFTSDQELKNMYLDIASELDRLAGEGG